MLLHADAIAGTILVILTSDERFERFHVQLLETGQLAKLQNPSVLHLLRCGLVAHVRDGKRIREPRPSKAREEGGFAGDAEVKI